MKNMNDYSKWDNVKDSDDEEEEPAPMTNPGRSQTMHDEQCQYRRDLKEEIERWLRRQIQKLPRDGGDRERPKGLTPLTPYRKLSSDERSTMAMLIAVAHFDDGQTNLERHPEMLNLVRHNRWLEEDPGALELLCRIHHQVMRKETKDRGNGENFDDSDDDNSYGVNPLTNYDARMRDVLMGAINALASPSKTNCPGGLLELITQICTPTNEEAREYRRKWQLKEFGKDALFDSLFPDLRKDAEEDFGEESSMDLWILLFLAVLAIAGIIALAVLYNGAHGNNPRTPSGSTTLTTTIAAAAEAASTTLTTTIAAATEAVKTAAAEVAQAAAGAVAGASEAAAGAATQGAGTAAGHSEL